jgi:hypothetical protein
VNGAFRRHFLSVAKEEEDGLRPEGLFSDRQIWFGLMVCDDDRWFGFSGGSCFGKIAGNETCSLDPSSSISETRARAFGLSDRARQKMRNAAFYCLALALVAVVTLSVFHFGDF